MSEASCEKLLGQVKSFFLRICFGLTLPPHSWLPARICLLSKCGVIQLTAEKTISSLGNGGGGHFVRQPRSGGDTTVVISCGLLHWTAWAGTTAGTIDIEISKM